MPTSSADRIVRTQTARIAVLAVAAILAILVTARAGTAEAQSGGVTTPGGTTTSAPSPTTAPPQGEPPAPSVRIIEARARPFKAYHFGLKPIRFAVTVIGKGPTDLRIDILRERSGVLERSIYQLEVPSGIRQRVVWDGLSSAGVAVRGKLRFRVRGINGEAIPMAKAAARPSASSPKRARKPAATMRLRLFDHIFPVRGKHSYGDGLGAGRGHQGQDLPAGCGTKVVAAQGGTVQVSAYQAAGAGYYVVIDAAGSDVDHAYFHLLGPSGLTPGQVVRTGQQIGQVGNTGRSFGCHLHFEMWSGPGWYEGGSVLDAAPSLRAWDRYS
jgi:murein DD-endopeptidase MepM/ murein hydrolase activator NlpD